MREKYDRVRPVTNDSMAHAHCMLITTSKDTQSEYVILIAFSQQLLQERAPTATLHLRSPSSLLMSPFLMWPISVQPNLTVVKCSIRINVMLLCLVAINIRDLFQ